MFWLVVGYLFLFIFRPYEYKPVLGEYHIERIYMIILLIAVFLSQKKRYIPHTISRSVVVFFMVMIISAIAGINFTNSYDFLSDYVKLLIFYFIIILTMQDEDDLRNFVLAYIGVMFLYAGKSAWEFFLHDRYTWAMGIRRMMGIDSTYGDPNTFAASIVYSLPFLWAMIQCKFEKPWIRRMLWGYGLLALVCIISTGSRSGMISALFFMLLVWFGSSRKFALIVTLVFTLVITWHVMPDKYQGRFESIFVKGVVSGGADASAESRIEMLKMGIRMFEKFPVLGVGPGNFRYGWSLFGIDLQMNAHNMYGMLLGELGFLGALAFVFLLYAIIVTHVRNIGQAKRLHMENSGLILISVASVQATLIMLFNGNFGGNLYRYNWLWIGAIGVLSSYFIQSKEQASKTKFFSKSIGINKGVS
jgi:O-antigen ligase